MRDFRVYELAGALVAIILFAIANFCWHKYKYHKSQAAKYRELTKNAQDLFDQGKLKELPRK